jgi:hypothetical protein
MRLRRLTPTANGRQLVNFFAHLLGCQRCFGDCFDGFLGMLALIIMGLSFPLSAALKPITASFLNIP